MADPTLENEIRALEERLLQPDVRKSPDELDRLLAEGFMEFGSSGRAYDKPAVIEGLAAEPESEVRFSLEDFRVKRLAANVVLATYRLAGTTPPRSGSLRSSIWIRRNGVWRLTFHQGTRAEEK